jgi:crossover junction endodeoxyribonuclease RusA
MDVLRFELPYPPSINHYYIHSASGVMLGAKGKSYRRDATFLLHKYRNICKDKRLAVTINVFPPDKRKRDIDNILKCLLDAMEHANVFDNDNQIDMLTVIRRNVVKDGCVQIWITECCSNE